MAKVTKVRKRCTVCGKTKMVKPRVRTCWRKRDGFSIYACGGKLEAAPVQRTPKTSAVDAPLTKIDREILKAGKTLARHNRNAARSASLSRKWLTKKARLEKKRAEIAAQLVTFAGQQVRTGSLTDHRARGFALGGDE